MKTWRTLLGDERGVALPLAMIMLVVLTMLTLTFMSLGAVEPQISRNLSDGARARQLAESGIEWGFNQLAGKPFNDATLLGSSHDHRRRQLRDGHHLQGAGDRPGAAGPHLGRRHLHGHAAQRPQHAQHGDQALIGSGNTLDTSTTVDNNKIVILKSTGTFNGASRTITAVVQRGNLPINAAVSLPGVQTDTYTQRLRCAISVGCYWHRRARLEDRGHVGGQRRLPPKLGVATYADDRRDRAHLEANAESGFNTLAKRDYRPRCRRRQRLRAATDGTAAPEPPATAGTRSPTDPSLNRRP